MLLNKDVGLVLEGGGMRGVFTAGVLDFFLDRGIYFPYVVGVSAGACNGLSYMSRQRGRAKKSNIDCLEKYRYIGLKYLWTQHSILDLETLYEKLPAEILPFDYDAINHSISSANTFILAFPDWLQGICTAILIGYACFALVRYIRKKVKEANKGSAEATNAE